LAQQHRRLQHAARSVSALTALSKLDTRSTSIKERAVAHYKKFEDHWVAKQAICMCQRQLTQGAAHPALQAVFAGYMDEPRWGVSLRAGQHEPLIDFTPFRRSKTAERQQPFAE